MHYRNGREARMVIRLFAIGSDGKIIVSASFTAHTGNITVNGSIAPG